MVKLKIKGSHYEYINKNYYFYTKDSVENTAAPSWLEPYGKPVLTNHDEDCSPLGRVQDFYLGTANSNGEPKKYVGIEVDIADEEGQQKVLDGRYFTVSVGSRANTVTCSECGQLINEDGLCDHVKGSLNDKGDPIYWIIDLDEYKEVSFVNVPADPYACIEEINLGDGWIKYQDFMSNRDKILSSLKLEDKLMIKSLKDSEQTPAAKEAPAPVVAPEVPAVDPVQDPAPETQTDKVAELESKVTEISDSLAKAKTEIADKDAEIQNLKDEFSKKDTILKEREAEIARHLDKIASIEKNYKDSLIDNIVDRSNVAQEEVDTVRTKLAGRTIESLLDKVNDLKEGLSASTVNDNTVKDPTLVDTKDNVEPVTPKSDVTKVTDKFAIFKQER